jgi:hypothetical protein
MSADGSTEIEWADGLYRFKLGLGEIRQLEEKFGEGVFRVCRRLELANMGRDYWIVSGLKADHVFDTIRIALIGGKTEPGKALKLCQQYVSPHLMESVTLAFALVTNAITGVKDDPVGKPSAEEGKSGAITTAASPSPPSTGQAQQ